MLLGVMVIPRFIQDTIHVRFCLGSPVGFGFAFRGFYIFHVLRIDILVTSMSVVLQVVWLVWGRASAD